MAKKSKAEAPKFLRHITARAIERCRGPMEAQIQTCKIESLILKVSLSYEIIRFPYNIMKLSS